MSKILLAAAGVLVLMGGLTARAGTADTPVTRLQEEPTVLGPYGSSTDANEVARQYRAMGYRALVEWDGNRLWYVYVYSE